MLCCYDQHKNISLLDFRDFTATRSGPDKKKYIYRGRILIIRSHNIERFPRFSSALVQPR